MPSFFEERVEDSGVMIAHSVPSREISPVIIFPGDIDLLVIPCVGDELIVDQALAIEVKIVRARFKRRASLQMILAFLRRAT